MNASKVKRFFWLVASIIAMPTMYERAAFAAGDVTATFHIESDYFNSLMEPATIHQIEASVAAELARAAESRFPFLAWRSADSNPAHGPQLILRMFDLPNGACDPQPTIKLQWFGVVMESEAALALSNVMQHELYQTCDPDIPTQEPDRLQSDVVQAVSDMLENSATQGKIIDQVLAAVPFARQLINHENKWLLLPVTAAELLAGEDSTIVAKFNFSVNGDERVGSEMRMQPRPVNDGSVKVLILELFGPPVNQNVRQGRLFWDDSLVELLAQSEDMKVYMTNYVANPFAGQTVIDTEVQPEL